MEKIDAHKFRKEVQRALRDQVIRIRKQGKANKDVAEFLGMSPSTAVPYGKSTQGEAKKRLPWKRDSAVTGKRGISPGNRSGISQKLLSAKHRTSFGFLSPCGLGRPSDRS